jgi:hypothetical protein
MRLLALARRGLLTAGASVRFGPAPAAYVSMKEDTASPVEVKTDPSSLLIRCLQKKAVVPPGAVRANAKASGKPAHAGGNRNRETEKAKAMEKEKEKGREAERVERKQESDQAAEKKRKVDGEPGGSEPSSARKKAVGAIQQGRDIQRIIYSEEALLQMKVSQLKEILAEKSLQVSGKKAELVQRVLDAQ